VMGDFQAQVWQLELQGQVRELERQEQQPLVALQGSLVQSALSMSLCFLESSPFS
jgi:hypothetical protein